MRKIIILLLLMNGHDALLAWRKEGCGICGGGAERGGAERGGAEGGGAEGGGAEGGAEHGGAGCPAAGLRRRRRGGQVAEKARSVSK